MSTDPVAFSRAELIALADEVGVPAAITHLKTKLRRRSPAKAK